MLGNIILAAWLVNGCRMVSRALPAQVAEMRSQGALSSPRDLLRLYVAAVVSVVLWPAEMVVRD